LFSIPAAGDVAPSLSEALFRERVVGVFQAHCLACHNDRDKKGGLSLQTRKGLEAGGDEGKVVEPGDPDRSRIVEVLAAEDGGAEMPKDGDPLPVADVAAVREWVALGAAWPADVALTPPAADSGGWWSFQPIVRGPLPPISSTDADWVRTPIDAFVSEKLRVNGLAPSQEADRRTLIRRICFDLVGLPPSPEEVDAFAADVAPDACERLADRLLASPHYGERWGRHWLDVVRFAESDGFEKNLMRPNAWPYRDYVVGALNEDMAYDRFVREQLAGDQLGADAATGFLVGGPWDEVKSPDPVLTAQQRADELHDIVSTTASTFLGLTVGCARCHSHKFDPIPQADYYALKACFDGVRFGERELRPADHEERLARARSLERELREVERKLWNYQPLAHPGRVLLLDDSAEANSEGPSVEEIVPAAGLEPHAPGDRPGEAGDSGGSRRPPNLGRSHRWWDRPAGRDLFAWKPRVSGVYRIWLSWGCGWSTHAQDAVYLLDRDGNPATTEDQVELARVDQRLPADGRPLDSERPLWSGFRLAGEHDLSPESIVVLRGGAGDSPATADVAAFEESIPGTPPPAADAGGPPLRGRVTRGANVERFAPVDARFLRMTITATTDVEPCIDELEVFTAGPEPRNAALASAGASATASGTYPNSEIHRLEHVNDGLYGNDRSWISNEPGRGWVQVEFPKVESIDRVVWSRDRGDPPQFEDRVATEYVIEVSLDGRTWRLAASSSDRLPRDYPASAADALTFWRLADAEADAYSELQSERLRLEGLVREWTSVPKGYAGRFEAPQPTHRFHRGDPMQPREEVPPGPLSAFADGFTLSEGAGEADRRMALAAWIAQPGNPLTARVAVNRLWHYHFGRGIVDTPSDFGANGGRPTHPELLDWLAAELIEGKWRLKAIHRVIVSSAAYRQSSRSNEAASAVDADVRLLWRFPPKRMEAELIRDAILAVSGALDLSMGGPGFDLFEPNDNYVKVYNSKRDFGPAEFRRMVYQSKPRMQLDDTFGAFDCPDGGQIAPARGSSITPLQALNLLNSPFVLQQARLFAGRIENEAGAEPEAQVQRAFLLAFGRPADQSEILAGAAVVREHGLWVLCRALFNAHEFVTVY
jgi:mono/diheme cytochrome c family protein